MQNILIICPEELSSQPCKSAPRNHNDFDEISLTFYIHLRRGLFIRTECFDIFFLSYFAFIHYVSYTMEFKKWKWNAFISLILNVSINIKKDFVEEKIPQTSHTHFWNVTKF